MTTRQGLLRRHLGGAAAFLILLSVVVVVPLVGSADPAAAHRQTVERCSYDPFAGQQCWDEDVPHTHPTTTTTAVPDPCPDPAHQHGDYGCHWSGDPHTTTPPTTTTTTAVPDPCPDPAHQHGDYGCHASYPSDHHCSTGEHFHGNDGCHPSTPSSHHCSPTEHMHGTHGCHPQNQPHDTDDGDDETGDGDSGEPGDADDANNSQTPQSGDDDEGDSGHDIAVLCRPNSRPGGGSNNPITKSAPMHRHGGLSCHPVSDLHCGAGRHAHGKRKCHPETKLHCGGNRHSHGSRYGGCHRASIDHDTCAYQAEGGDPSARHYHPKSNGDHRGCQTHDQPACDPFDASVWPPGPPHADVVIAPCEVSFEGTGVDPATLEWNPLDGTICEYAANQGFSGASARTLCLRHHNLDVVSWDDSITAEELQAQLVAEGIRASQTNWARLVAFVNWLDSGAEWIIQTTVDALPTTPVLRLLPEEFEDAVCGRLASTAGRVAAAREGSRLLRISRGVAGYVVTDLYCSYVVEDD